MQYNELRVVIGPNGAGKTTLLDVICGKTKPTSGKILFGKGINLVGKNAEDITKLGVGRKFQAPSVYGNLSVWQNLDLSVKRAEQGRLSDLDGPVVAGGARAHRGDVGDHRLIAPCA